MKKFKAILETHSNKEGIISAQVAEITADYFTLETNGAVSFWSHCPLRPGKDPQDILVVVYGPGAWSGVKQTADSDYPEMFPTE